MEYLGNSNNSPLEPKSKKSAGHLLEYDPGMELWEFKVFGRKLQENKSLMTSVSSKHELFLECIFMNPHVYPIGVYFGLLIITCCYYSIKCLNYPLYASTENTFLSHAVCSCDRT